MAQVKPVNKKKMTKATLVASIVSIVILVAFAVSMLSSTGLMVRAQNGASSENFKVNGAMLGYFAQASLENWYNGEYMEEMKAAYGDYYQLFLQYGMGPFNPSLPYDEQVYDKETNKTYADLFVEKANEYVTRILSLCEAAMVDSKVNYAEIKAEAEEHAAETIDSIKLAAAANNMDLTAYIRAYLGKDMNKKDLEKCLVLEQIASHYAEAVYDRIKEDMSDARIEEFFKDNIGSFFTAGILAYSFTNPETVTYPVAADYEGGEESAAYKSAKETAEKNKTDLPVVEDYVGGEESKAYKAAYAAAEALKAANEAQMAIDKAVAEQLANAKSENEFKTIILEYEYSDAFDAAYDAIKSKLGESAPTEDELAQYKSTLKNQVIEAALAGKDALDAETVEDENATEWEKQQGTLPTTVIAKLATSLKSAQQTTAYSSTSNLGQKLFGGVKAEYGVPYKSYETEGTNALVGDSWYEDTLVANKNSIAKAIEIYKDKLNEEDADTKAINESIESLEKSLEDAEKTLAEVGKTGHYTYTAVYVTEAAHREDAKVRDAGHILLAVDSTIKENTKTTFKTSEEAKEAAQLIFNSLNSKATDGVVTKEVFEEIGTGKSSDGSLFYDNVCVGQMTKEFEEWLFSAEKVGQIGLVESSYGWHVMYYGGEGEEATWEYLAHVAATNEDYEGWEKELDFAVEVNSALFVNAYNNK
jgi:hypothetical protein